MYVVPPVKSSVTTSVRANLGINYTSVNKTKSLLRGDNAVMRAMRGASTGCCGKVEEGHLKYSDI